MQYDEIVHLRDNHPAWALLRSSNAPLVLDFLGRVFVDRNASDVAAADLADELDEELFALNQRLGENAFPRSASAYLDDWAHPERGWLRKFYPTDSDEPRYDLAPATEKVLLWIRDLRARDFVGTESRLTTAFELLRQMVFGADDDPERRLAELRRRRQEIDDEIARVERGEVTVLDAVGQRDRYQQFSRLARELLSDFREVEENFRSLDRTLREKIAGWNGSKGELLDDILKTRGTIAESDQGRSFQSFYDFLLSHHRQAEFSDLLQRLRQIETIADVDHRMTHIHFDWIDAAERTQATVRMLSEQLRRFLDDRVWLENRRVFDILRSIESQAMSLREHRDPRVGMEIDEASVRVNLPFERPLHRRRSPAPIDSANVGHGEADADSTVLLEQMHVDRDELVRTVRGSLRSRDQVGLGELVSDQPLQQGLAELIGYLSLDDPRFAVVFDETRRDRIEWRVDDDGDGAVERVADLPQVTFNRNHTEAT